jgi:hypothetical protein
MKNIKKKQLLDCNAYIFIFNPYQKKPQYGILREKGFVSPTTSTGDDCFEGYCPNHIYVYVRKSLLNKVAWMCNLLHCRHLLP